MYTFFLSRPLYFIFHNVQEEKKKDNDDEEKVIDDHHLHHDFYDNDDDDEDDYERGRRRSHKSKMNYGNHCINRCSFSALVTVPSKSSGTIRKIDKTLISLEFESSHAFILSFQQKLVLGFKQYGPKIRPHVSWGLVSIQIVCKGI